MNRSPGQRGLVGWLRAAAGSDACAAIALVILNVWICARLFWVEYTSNFGSGEGFAIAMARYISRHWGSFSWWPLWHLGMPYQNTYVPLLHVTAAALSTVAGLSAPRAYHILIGLAYSLGPATLFLMLSRLGANRAAAFCSALAYSLFSPSAALFPEIRGDLGGPFFGRRLHVLTFYGEGPHIAVLTLLPLAILALERAVHKRTGRSFALAALPIAAIFLTNVPGSMALGLAVFCWICAQPADRRAAAVGIAGAAAILAYGLACFGAPPSSFRFVFGNVGSMHSGFSQSLTATPFLLPLLLAAIVVGGHLVSRTQMPLFARFGLLYFALTFVLVLTARKSDSFELLPQASRLHLEMELAACLLLGWMASLVYRQRRIRYAVVGLIVAASIFQLQHYRKRARLDLTPVNPMTRSEYTTARWLDAHMDGQRVFALGSTAFWLNAFTDTPQVTGCCDQNEALPAIPAEVWLVRLGVKPDETARGILWLQALGAHAVVVNGPNSTDVYKDFLAPERFDQALPALYREHGDTIYAIPQRSQSLAHSLRPEEVPPSGTTPARADDAAARYVAAIEDPAARPIANCDWTGSSAKIRAHLGPGDLVSVQAAYFNGWKAFVNGVPKTVSADGIGLILVHPECQGDCVIDLRWTGPADFWPAAFVSFAALALCVWLFAHHVFDAA
jgi:hypothetical protein